ncbi:MAG: asparagine--tRNA ligase [Deltaproteobacteria bacterium]|jgi:asparaginyl-tRNA synthetase|nr:asparagine--tRNA ligase [Deltaproteobacteria bacterium]
MSKERRLPISIKELLAAREPRPNVLVQGWVRTRRDSRDFSFLEINDGSILGNLQVVVAANSKGYSALKEARLGAAVSVYGDLKESLGQGQKWELGASELVIVGQSDSDYPLQKKRHTDEYLREIAHLRPRTNKYGAAFRLRSEAALAIHDFFRAKGFFYVHAPIITGSDAEGAGEMFQVTTLKEFSDPAFKNDFFGHYAALTVSGQLEAELLALALGKVYTFAPAFRAENSNTARHAAEFWMVEPEMAFADLAADMELAESLVKTVAKEVIERRAQDVGLFNQFVEPGLEARLRVLIEADYPKVQYREAIKILTKANKRFEFSPTFGADLATEHEKFLAEEYFLGPVFVYDYPKTLKPFYMRLNDDQETVAAMDLLVPKAGELIGGSQREERLDVLTARLTELGLKADSYWWYLDSRRWGSAPHAGFGLGFERLIMTLTGIANIRDAIPFPRTPKTLAF